MRQLYAYDANDVNECTRRLVEDGMHEHGTHKHADGSGVDSLFCIPCSLENNAFSVLHYVIKVNFGMFRTS